MHKKGEKQDLNINAIPNNMETYMAFMLGNHLTFIDSFQFMSSSLHRLVGNLPKDDLINTSQVFKGKRLSLMSQKGVYSHDFMDSFEKFNQTELPTKDHFYSILNDQHITDDEYDHAKKVWKTFKIKTMGEYHDLYLGSDVLLLTDVFENFRKTCMQYYNNKKRSHTQLDSRKQVNDSYTKVIKQEPLYVDPEYESYVSWRQRRDQSERQHSSNRVTESSARVLSQGSYERPPIQMKKFDGRLNPIGRNGQPLQCHVCKSIAHFERNCPNRKRSGDTESAKRSDHFLAPSVDDEGVVDCKISDIYVGDAFNHMILDTGCPHVAGKIWVDCFFEGLSNEELKLVKKSSSTTKFKCGGGRVLQSLYRIQAPILVAGCHVTISFDVVESDIPLLLGKKTMKNCYLVINASDDTAEFTINGERKHVELSTSKSGHWCIEIQPIFPLRQYR